MNQLNQLGMRISHIDSAFDQWIKQQNTNYNTFAVLYTLATEGSRTQKYIGEEWSLPKQTVSGTCKTLAEQGLLTFHESEQDKRERLLSLTEQGKNPPHHWCKTCRNSANEFLPPSVKNVQPDCLPIWTRWPN